MKNSLQYAGIFLLFLACPMVAFWGHSEEVRQIVSDIKVLQRQSIDTGYSNLDVSNVEEEALYTLNCSGFYLGMGIMALREHSYNNAIVNDIVDSAANHSEERAQQLIDDLRAIKRHDLVPRVIEFHQELCKGGICPKGESCDTIKNRLESYMGKKVN